MGFIPSKIKHLTLAVEHGLGSLTPDVIGEAVESLIVPFKKETNVFSTLGKYMFHEVLPFARRIYSILKISL